jgi:hypothetical protein
MEQDARTALESELSQQADLSMPTHAEADESSLKEKKYSEHYTISCSELLLEKNQFRQFELGSEILSAEDFFSDSGFMPIILHMAFERMNYLLPFRANKGASKYPKGREIGFETNPEAIGLFGRLTQLYFNYKYDALLFPLIVNDYCEKLLGSEPFVNVNFIYNFMQSLGIDAIDKNDGLVDGQLDCERLLAIAQIELANVKNNFVDGDKSSPVELKFDKDDLGE